MSQVASTTCSACGCNVAKLDNVCYNISIRYILHRYIARVLSGWAMGSTRNTRHFALGLLAQRPICGYGVKRLFESLSWLIDGPSFGSLYPALHSLMEDGLTTVEVVTSQDRPPRKVYSITEAGKRVLREWTRQPMKSSASLKAFLMRLLLAGNLPRADLRARLEQRRSQVAAHFVFLFGL
jgi:PadR family transcriptional regulator AphA